MMSGIKKDDFELLTAVILIRHLNGINQASFVRPAVLITDAYNALNNQPYRRQKDKEFTGTLRTRNFSYLKIFVLKFVIYSKIHVCLSSLFSFFLLKKHAWNEQVFILCE